MLRPTRFNVRALSSTPWFVDHNSLPSPTPLVSRAPPLPQDAPKILCDLHSQLAQSPHLELSKLQITRALSREMGPPLPLRAAHGKRKRGGTFAGESAFDIAGSLWNWTVFAEVKEGTEKKGAIESVVRQVRKSLLAAQPPLPLAPNSKRRMQNGWAMIDGGDFAVHVLSKSVREKYFNSDN
ncbi:hypothetical protein GYMLUDRAFT_74182 [Collybiopsis luxurians FD-317 M1]|uniref:Uncharacterized protein n=1 Tax=Collybiopsis luxurians FD-317 M1 TaxID=944289 RepID=A0A0D0CV00_9AGAR|nr:hypothetical protein GYMLUDRAFT_74182 [Collybiopsis luxurians FD-317 M1]